MTCSIKNRKLSILANDCIQITSQVVGIVYYGQVSFTIKKVCGIHKTYYEILTVIQMVWLLFSYENVMLSVSFSDCYAERHYA